jgi:hypothetical protein
MPLTFEPWMSKLADADYVLAISDEKWEEVIEMPRKAAATAEVIETPAPKRGRKATPTGESKHDKFVRLGEQRVNRAVKTIEAIGKLSGGGYEYSEEDAKLLLKALAEAVSGVAFKFKKHSPSFMFFDR